MNQQVKQKWISALLSGDYQQGKEALCEDGKYCCLGVLCDLYRKEHPETQWQKGTYSREFFLGQADYLPSEVERWAGLTQQDPEVHIGDGFYKKLSDLNDTGSSFEKIANLVNEQL
jgi:hypothetical protein